MVITGGCHTCTCHEFNSSENVSFMYTSKKVRTFCLLIMARTFV